MTTKIDSSINNSFYNSNAEELAEQYLSKSFEEVHASWLTHLPSILKHASNDDIRVNAALSNAASSDAPSIKGSHLSPIRILDIGAGAGRDAKYLAEQSTANQVVQVYAVEPAQTLASLGQKLTAGLNVSWFQDSLPALDTVSRQEFGFDLILLSAIWMHIPTQERADSIQTLAKLLAPKGKLVITLRHGPCSDERQMHRVSDKEVEQLAESVGLSVIVTSANETDKLGRAEVYWQTLVLAHASAATASMRSTCE